MLKSTLPIAMVSVGMLRPFVEEVQRRGGDHRTLLAGVDLDEAGIQEGYQPSRKLWEYIERAAEMLGDPHFGFSIGQDTPTERLQNLQDAQPGFPTLGESLSKLIVDSQRLTNQAAYTLLHDAKAAMFRQRRLFRPISPPIQSEGFLVGLLLRVMQVSIGPNWEPAAVRVHLISKSTVPATALAQTSFVEGNKEGVHLEFPSRWLLIGQGGKYDRNEKGSFFDSFDWLAALRLEIEKKISDPNLRLTSVSAAFSISERALQKALQERGTSFQNEVALCRAAQAKKLLRETDLPVGVISAQVGMPAVPSFSRAFRKWERKSPRDYRRQHNAK